MPSIKSSDVTWGYKPTKVDIEKAKHKMNSFKLSWDWIFHTIQGEWRYVWYPTTFVRLHWCNLKCSWCDSWYTWRTDTEEYYSEPFDVAIEDLTSEIIKAQTEKGMDTYVCRSVVFTWWEPLLQQKKIEKWHKQNESFLLMIETNWTVMPSDYILEKAYYISCSPKLNSSGNSKGIDKEVLKALSQYGRVMFKFVCSTEEDVEEVIKIAEENELPRHQVAIMPEWVTKEENEECFRRIIPRILKEWLLVTPRYHNVMFDWSKRRV